MKSLNLKLLSLILILFVGISNLGTAGDIPVYPKPLNVSGGLQPNTTFNYTFNLTNDISCNDVLLSESVQLTTGVDGWAFHNINADSLSLPPAYICEYVDGSLRQVHEVSDLTFGRVLSRFDINSSQDVCAEVDTANPICLSNAVTSTSGGLARINDADNDTWVTVEENADDDTIRFFGWDGDSLSYELANFSGIFGAYFKIPIDMTNQQIRTSSSIIANFPGSPSLPYSTFSRGLIESYGNLGSNVFQLGVSPGTIKVWSRGDNLCFGDGINFTAGGCLSWWSNDPKSILVEDNLRVNGQVYTNVSGQSFTSVNPISGATAFTVDNNNLLTEVVNLTASGNICDSGGSNCIGDSVLWLIDNDVLVNVSDTITFNKTKYSLLLNQSGTSVSTQNLYLNHNLTISNVTFYNAPKVGGVNRVRFDGLLQPFNTGNFMTPLGQSGITGSTTFCQSVLCLTQGSISVGGGITHQIS